jgi:hypothetical protein
MMNVTGTVCDIETLPLVYVPTTVTTYVPAYWSPWVAVMALFAPEPHPPAPPTIAIDNASSSRLPSRRRRGSTSSSSEAAATPEPAPYQGIRCALCRANIVPESTLPGMPGKCSLDVTPLSVSVVVCVAPEPEALTVTELGLNEIVGV